MTRPWSSMYTSSRPPRVQRGPAPPSVETCHRRAPTFGKGRTYTSCRPDSSELYATARPSGEIAGFRSTPGACSNVSRRTSPVSRTIRRSSSDAAGASPVMMMPLPSGRKSGWVRSNERIPMPFTSASTEPLPSGRTQPSPTSPSNHVVKTMRLPSGVHVGADKATTRSEVNRVKVPRLKSYVQRSRLAPT